MCNDLFRGGWKEDSAKGGRRIDRNNDGLYMPSTYSVENSSGGKEQKLSNLHLDLTARACEKLHQQFYLSISQLLNYLGQRRRESYTGHRSEYNSVCSPDGALESKR